MPSVILSSNEIINDTEVVIACTDKGKFKITDQSGETLSESYTLYDAKRVASVKLSQKKVRVKVPFYSVATLKHGTAIGFHGKTGKVLVRWTGEATTRGGEQIELYHKALRNDTPKEKIAELARLNETISKLERKRKDIIHEYELSLNKAVRDAIAAASLQTSLTS